jgi:hypothetical protein
VLIGLVLGGVQRAAVGLLGEYVGRIMMRFATGLIVERAVNASVRDPRGRLSGSQADYRGSQFGQD